MNLRRKFLNLCFIFLNCVHFVSLTSAAAVISSIDYRLPNNTIPKHYTVSIETQLDKDHFKFYGKVTIQIKAVQNSNEIVLHSKQSEILRVKLKNFKTEEEIQIRENEFNENNEFLRIPLEEGIYLTPDEDYLLLIEYQSILRTDKLGFYRSSYINDKGEKIWLAATQFAPTEARHGFPCYDEPRFKGTFDITLIYPDEYFAISNMEVQKSEPDSKIGLQRTTFETTPIMSTYLIGFVISNFAVKKANLKNIKQEIYVRPNGIKDTRLFDGYARSILQRFIDFFPEKLPLSTMKHVAIPDFHFGGMENWGITTYAESKFLFNRSLDTAEHEMGALGLIAHEMAHNWFGNLVTMEWWTHVWMKEGFSTFFQYLGPNTIYKNYNVMQYFLIKALHIAMDYDAKPITRPMNYYVEKQADIMANYDRIAYEKSACVLRMFYHSLGPRNFLEAIAMYLNKNKYNSVKEDDLLNIFEFILRDEKDFKIKEIFQSWSSQKGYPLLNVHIDNKTKSISIKQERFVNSEIEIHVNKWKIPITIAWDNKKSFDKTSPLLWMNTEEIKFDVPAEVNKSEWIILNPQQTGYYRVNYDMETWSKLIEVLLKEPTKIHVLNRAQLLDDSFSLARTGRLSYSVPFNLARYISNEFEYAPWAVLQKHLNYLKRMLSENSIYEKFNNYIRLLIENPLIVALNNNPSHEIDIPIQRIKRQIIINQACKLKIEKCLKSIPDFSNNPDLKDLYYCNLIEKGEIKFNNLINMIENSNNRQNLTAILRGIGCSKDKNFLKLSLLLIYNKMEKKFTSSDISNLILSIAEENVNGTELVLDFIQIHWKYLQDEISEKDANSLLTNVASYITNENLYEKFNGILKDVSLSEKVKKDSLQQIFDNLKWNHLYRERVEDYFNNKPNSAMYVFNYYSALLITITTYFVL